jgi:hypothetical protein
MYTGSGGVFGVYGVVWFGERKPDFVLVGGKHMHRPLTSNWEALVYSVGHLLCLAWTPW